MPLLQIILNRHWNGKILYVVNVRELPYHESAEILQRPDLREPGDGSGQPNGERRRHLVPGHRVAVFRVVRMEHRLLYELRDGRVAVVKVEPVQTHAVLDVGVERLTERSETEREEVTVGGGVAH